MHRAISGCPQDCYHCGQTIPADEEYVVHGVYNQRRVLTQRLLHTHCVDDYKRYEEARFGKERE